VPPETSMRWALTQRLTSDGIEAIIGPTSPGSPARILLPVPRGEDAKTALGF
jgi:hypothetical protein